MDAHTALGGLWDVFDDQTGLDVVVSIHKSDGVRQLVLPGQQAATTLTSEVEAQIRDWLDNLSNQPTIQNPRA